MSMEDLSEAGGFIWRKAGYSRAVLATTENWLDHPVDTAINLDLGIQHAKTLQFT